MLARAFGPSGLKNLVYFILISAENFQQYDSTNNYCISVSILSLLNVYEIYKGEKLNGKQSDPTTNKTCTAAMIFKRCILTKNKTKHMYKTKIKGTKLIGTTKEKNKKKWK